MNEKLSKQILHELNKNHGCIQCPGFIAMTTEGYRQTMGVESEEALQQSIDVIERGWADVQAGRSRSYKQVLEELDETDAE